jgi:hypothetical protein
MNSIQIRFILFLFGCIGMRLLFVIIAKNVSIKHLQYLGYLALVMLIGFMYIYLTGSRQTGVEVLGDKIWWNNLRPLHALLYGLFAYNAIKGNPNSWIFLFLDVIIGLISFLTYHYIKGDFRKLIS